MFGGGDRETLRVELFLFDRAHCVVIDVFGDRRPNAYQHSSAAADSSLRATAPRYFGRTLEKTSRRPEMNGVQHCGPRMAGELRVAGRGFVYAVRPERRRPR
jgi:hypothetical protein